MFLIRSRYAAGKFGVNLSAGRARKIPGDGQHKGLRAAGREEYDMRKFLFLTGLIGFFSGCVPDPYIQWSERLDAARRINENWIVDCSTDRVTNVRRCFAGTFGVGTNKAPFQVVYRGNRGPFIQVGAHDFPGRRPLVRFDNDPQPMTILDDGGVSSVTPQMNVVSRMLRARTASVRYHTWPHGGRDMTLNVAGFDLAWARLQKLLTGAPAPNEVVPGPGANVMNMHRAKTQ